MTSMTHDTKQDQQRTDYIAGLRKLADLIEANPHLTLPLTQTFSAFCDTKTELHDWLAALPGVKSKRINYDDQHMIVTAPRGMFGPHTVNAWIPRDEVCRRVVTGTETVKMRAVKAQPARTETREVVEWICEPVLTEATA